MNLRSRKIILIDQSNLLGFDPNSDQLNEVYFLDPLVLFTRMDWTQYDEDVQVINQIYSVLFEEVVINKKQLVCFWPLVDQYGNDWFELKSLCDQSNFELEVHKGILFNDDYYGLSPKILNEWKKFVFFLIESLLEDIQLNEQVEEIATLTGEDGSIILFRMEQNGSVGYSFASGSEYFDFSPGFGNEPVAGELSLPFFDSFNAMLDKLLGENDLSRFQTKFMDKHLEKAYFNVLAKNLKTKNLIHQWMETYSLN